MTDRRKVKERRKNPERRSGIGAACGRRTGMERRRTLYDYK